MSDKPIENTALAGAVNSLQENSKTDRTSLTTESTHDGSSNNDTIEGGSTSLSTNGTIDLTDDKNSSAIGINNDVAFNNPTRQSEGSIRKNKLMDNQCQDASTEFVSASGEDTYQENLPLPTSDDKTLDTSSPTAISTGESEVSSQQNKLSDNQCQDASTESVAASGQDTNQENLPSLTSDVKTLDTSSPTAISTGETEVSSQQNKLPDNQCQDASTESVSASGEDTNQENLSLPTSDDKTLDTSSPMAISTGESEVSSQQNKLPDNQCQDASTESVSASGEDTNQENLLLPKSDDKTLETSSPTAISIGESEVSSQQNKLPDNQCQDATTESVSPNSEDTNQENLPLPTSDDTESDKATETVASLGENSIRETLCSLGFVDKSIDFLMDNWEKFKAKPNILAKKCNVDIQIIVKAVRILSKEKVISLSQEEILKIEEYMKANPETDDYEEIAVMCDIEDAERVREYLDNKELSEIQKSSISNSFRKGNSIKEISSFLKISSEKVETYLTDNKLSFVGKIGENAFNIINKTLGKIKKVELIEKICSRDLKLQDNLAVRLKTKDPEAYSIVEQYFNKFEESKNFMNIKCLTIDDINMIKSSEVKDIEQISIKLQVVESLIEDYMTSYNPYEIELSNMHKQQTNNISNILQEIQPKEIIINDYRKIVTNSYNDIIQKIQNPNEFKKVRDLFTQLIPVAFYYLKCNLPFKEITSIFSSREKMIVKMSTQDIFHLIFQQSDPTLRAICIEHYSFSNPIPFYFPVLKDYAKCRQTKPQFDICKELWYSVTPFRALISFGLGRAGWNQTGKSSLLNLIFESDFENGSTKGSLFHAGSIDLQMMKNLFSNITNKEKADSIKWAFFDCHGPTDLGVVKLLSKFLKVFIIHILESDYEAKSREIKTDLNNFQLQDKHIFLFIRDCKSNNDVIETRDKNYTVARIPNLTCSEVNIDLVTKRMKEIGHRILQINISKEYKVNSKLVETFLGDLDSPRYRELKEDVQKIENIMGYVKSHGSKEKISFDFLSYYPHFVKLMGLKHSATYESDQEKIEELNKESNELFDKLKSSKRCEIVNLFNQLLSDKNSSLLLWKLSQRLSLYSNIFNAKVKRQEGEVVEQKNDKYTVEILWRESLLSGKYIKPGSAAKQQYDEMFGGNLSKHVQCGEPFELIDGDNLVFFSKEIDSLLGDFYTNQSKLISEYNRNNCVQIKEAPLVLSIIGPQSSGKSTLLNYTFGCKFLTSSGRCTRGVYGSLLKLDRPIIKSDSLLILDTEGLDAIERGNIKDTSMIHFDRTMVLFCLSVSQAVIINVKGDIGNEMQNLLQICAYSLSRLKVNRTVTPKIFFVLNQQADPDPSKHLDAINLLMTKLNEDTESGESEETASNLIEVTRDNLFIIPSAFNCQEINRVSGKLFDFDVTKLSPTMNFAKKCSDLRTAIIHQIETISLNDRSPFSSMSDWIEMAGTIWEVIMKYQDIVKYRNLQEIKCTEKLRELVRELMSEHILKHRKEFEDKINDLINHVKSLENLLTKPFLFDQQMGEFDQFYNEHCVKCLKEYKKRIEITPLFKKMPNICHNMEVYLKRQNLMERRNYEDKLKTQINLLETDEKVTQSMKTFQDAVVQEIDTYILLTNAEQYNIFEEIWLKCFEQEDPEEELREKRKCLEDLYSVFLVECDIMQPKQELMTYFNANNFKIDIILSQIRIELFKKFSKETDNFFSGCSQEQCTLKFMKPYAARMKYDYLSPSRLLMEKYYEQISAGIFTNLVKYIPDKISGKVPSSYKTTIREIVPSAWVPIECLPLLYHVSGYYSSHDTNWGNLDWKKQAILLSVSLRSVNDQYMSTWDQLLDDLLKDAEIHLVKDSSASPATIKLIVQDLKYRIRLTNYELSHIYARLTNFAESGLSSFVFSAAFEKYWNTKMIKHNEDRDKKAAHKLVLEKYFLQKIKARQMTRGAFNRATMDKSDENFSNTFALKFIESVMRESEAYALEQIKNDIHEQKILFSNKTLFLEAHEIIIKEVSKDPDIEVLKDNFVIDFFCQRNEALKKLFTEKWENCLNKSYKQMSVKVITKFYESINLVRHHLDMMLAKLKENANKNKVKDLDIRCFDSDCNFELAEYSSKVNSSSDTRESPFKAMSIFLKKHLDPNVTSKEMDNYFMKFKINDDEMKLSDTYTLASKDDGTQLKSEMFKKLVNTTMFNENIFNLYVYLRNFVQKLASYKYELNEKEFYKISTPIRDTLYSEAIGCTNQCPSCGKFCEREVHTDGTKCQIKTGHQFSSMGGKVWQADDQHTAILYRCDNYHDDMQVQIPGKTMKWRDFKHETSTEWNWELCSEKAYEGLKLIDLKLMKGIWNKFGRGILEYYKKNTGVEIAYTPYDPSKATIVWKYSVCFVVDGTGSMSTDIAKARLSIETLINTYKSTGKDIEFRVVIYRDHCDANILEEYPNSSKRDFTKSKSDIASFMNNIGASGGGDFPEAVLDGLGTAVKANWRADFERKNLIIHIYDAPPHGDFPNYKNHDSGSSSSYCCCCSSKCPFDWDRDVWDAMKKQGISYYGISTGSSYTGYENTMKAKLGALCDGFTVCGKEEVSEAVMKIFIQYTKLD